MKNVRKKLLYVMLVGTLFISSMTCYANNDSEQKIKNEMFSYSINEYELLKSLDEEESFSIDINSEIGETTEIGGEVNNKKYEKDIFKYSRKITKQELIKQYKENIYKLKEWNIEELKNVGYNEKQINAIKKFDGSEELMSASATTVFVDIGLRNINYSSNGTTVDVIAEFNAEGIQSNWFCDVFGVVWSSPLTIVSKVGTVRYVSAEGYNKYYTHSPINAGSLYGLQMIFDKYKQFNYPDPYAGTYYIHSGSMIISLKSNTIVPDIAALATYGYNYISISPSLSVTGELSFSFSSGVNNAGEDYISN